MSVGAAVGPEAAGVAGPWWRERTVRVGGALAEGVGEARGLRRGWRATKATKG